MSDSITVSVRGATGGTQTVVVGKDSTVAELKVVSRDARAAL